MSLDRSLKSASALVRHRNVLTRDERIQKLKETEKWQEGRSVFGLPKVANRKLVVGKAEKEPAADATAAAGAAGAAATPGAAAPAGAAPAKGAAAPAKGAAAPAKGKTEAKPGAAAGAAAAPAKGKK